MSTTGARFYLDRASMVRSITNSSNSDDTPLQPGLAHLLNDLETYAPYRHRHSTSCASTDIKTQTAYLARQLLFIKTLYKHYVKEDLDLDIMKRDTERKHEATVRALDGVGVEEREREIDELVASIAEYIQKNDFSKKAFGVFLDADSVEVTAALGDGNTSHSDRVEIIDEKTPLITKLPESKQDAEINQNLAIEKILRRDIVTEAFYGPHLLAHILALQRHAKRHACPLVFPVKMINCSDFVMAQVLGHDLHFRTCCDSCRDRQPYKSPAIENMQKKSAYRQRGAEQSIYSPDTPLGKRYADSKMVKYANSASKAASKYWEVKSKICMYIKTCEHIDGLEKRIGGHRSRRLARGDAVESDSCARFLESLPRHMRGFMENTAFRLQGKKRKKDGSRESEKRDEECGSGGGGGSRFVPRYAVVTYGNWDLGTVVDYGLGWEKRVPALREGSGLREECLNMRRLVDEEMGILQRDSGAGRRFEFVSVVVERVIGVARSLVRLLGWTAWW